MSTLELAYARDERIAQQIVALNVRITCLYRQDYDRSRAFKQIRKHEKIMKFQKNDRVMQNGVDALKK